MPAQLQVYWLTVYKSAGKCADKRKRAETVEGDYGGIHKEIVGTDQVPKSS